MYTIIDLIVNSTISLFSLLTLTSSLFHILQTFYLAPVSLYSLFFPIFPYLFSFLALFLLRRYKETIGTQVNGHSFECHSLFTIPYPTNIQM